MRTQNNVKRNLCKKNSEESLPKKSNNFSIIFFSSKDSTKETLKGHSLFKNMKRNLYQKIFQETVPCQKIWRKTSTKNSSEEKSLPKNEETSPATKLQTILTRNIKKNQNWWNQRKKCFVKFQFPFLAIVFDRDFFWMDFLGRDPSSDIVC